MRGTRTMGDGVVLSDLSVSGGRSGFESRQCIELSAWQQLLQKENALSVQYSANVTATDPELIRKLDLIVHVGEALLPENERIATFQEYAERGFAPEISTNLEKSSHIDLVWDLPDSLKAALRDKTEKATRKRVAPSNFMPKNWKDFL
uniref:Uncharacterized protein n=1 Tax=Timema poppense TaxID=170557 RepID=A0A7R9DC92_TIMPO|nr:unnamed protein product [Timema poppensis]